MPNRSRYLLVVLLSTTLVGCSGGKDSYNLGYEVGMTPAINTLYSDKSITSQCRSVLLLARIGTTNDGIDWESVDTAQFLKGCEDAFKDKTK